MKDNITKLILPKVYVPVSVDFDEDGNILPKEITWEDGTK